MPIAIDEFAQTPSADKSVRHLFFVRAMLVMLCCVFALGALTAAHSLILEDPCPDSCHLVAKGVAGSFIPAVTCEGPCPSQRTCEDTVTTLGTYHWVMSCICNWGDGENSNALTCRPCNAYFHWGLFEGVVDWWFECDKDECTDACYMLAEVPPETEPYARVCVCQ